MANINKLRGSLAGFQSEAFWIAIGCYLFHLYIKSEYGKDMFSDEKGVVTAWWGYIKNINGTILWLSAITNGKRLYVLISSMKKLPQNLDEVEKPKPE